MKKSMQVAVLEPYYGGSHAAFVDAIVARSRHDCALLTMPARKWKWRMRGAAAWFVREGGLAQLAPDVILCNDMLSVADLRALLPPASRAIPIACYFHENQLTYPLSDDDWRDYQFGMTHITSCLASDAVWFNSDFHRKDFLQAAGDLLGKMPDHVPADVISDIEAKSAVFYPPVEAPAVSESSRAAPIRILWSHRWEYDKNPEAFFRSLLELVDSGAEFELILAGEQFRTAPPVFEDSWERLAPHITHAGYVESRDGYRCLLQSCDLVVSTAIQENFGIGVVEAMLAGCQPVFPDRLAYPELIPKDLHQLCLYGGDDFLTNRLRQLLGGKGWLSAEQRECLNDALISRFDARVAVGAIDDALERLAPTP